MNYNLCVFEDQLLALDALAYSRNIKNDVDRYIFHCIFYVQFFVRIMYTAHVLPEKKQTLKVMEDTS